MALAFFNETSQQLSSSYSLLEGRVRQLTEELKDAAVEKEHARQTKNQIAHQMQALLDFLPGGVIVLDEKGLVVESNPAARKLLDLDSRGKLWRNVIGLCFSPKNDDGYEVSTKTGRRISIATSSLEGKGQIILLTDQTDTRKLQDNLRRHERLSVMGKMVSALAHQIRTPLSAALLYSGHLCDDNLVPEKRSLFSKKLLGRLRHMEKQVRDMMLFVKSELPLNDVVSLQDLQSGLKDASEIALTTTGSTCEWVNTSPQVQIKCNREALISALMNLINNGIQAAEDKSAIRVSLSEQKQNDISYARIVIEDNGAGMSDSELLQAQELFVTTKTQGTGLGLYVVQSVVRAHGGVFQLKSKAGVGSRAVIDLPISINM